MHVRKLPCITVIIIWEMITLERKRKRKWIQFSFQPLLAHYTNFISMRRTNHTLINSFFFIFWDDAHDTTLLALTYLSRPRPFETYHMTDILCKCIMKENYIMVNENFFTENFFSLSLSLSLTHSIIAWKLDWRCRQFFMLKTRHTASQSSRIYYCEKYEFSFFYDNPFASKFSHHIFTKILWTKIYSRFEFF